MRSLETIIETHLLLPPLKLNHSSTSILRKKHENRSFEKRSKSMISLRRIQYTLWNCQWSAKILWAHIKILNSSSISSSKANSRRATGWGEERTYASIKISDGGSMWLTLGFRYVPVCVRLCKKCTISWYDLHILLIWIIYNKKHTFFSWLSWKIFVIVLN